MPPVEQPVVDTVEETVPEDTTTTATTMKTTDNHDNNNNNNQNDFTRDARIYEYGSAANPQLAPIPVLVHPATLHESGPTAIHPFDISDFLKIDYPCTSPNLMASFLRIVRGETLSTTARATSQAFYVIRGTGYTTSLDDGKIAWSTGDLMVFPASAQTLQHACTREDQMGGGAALYWIHDEPLLNYLGVQPAGNKFRTTLFKKQDMLERVEEIKHSSEGHSNNRLGVLLGNAACDQTKTLTHVLWSLLNSIPAKTVQRPHRHNSVALDLCVSAKPGVYTLIGNEIDDNGFIVNPIRCDWVPGAAFLTPPALWHSHHNESDDVAWVLPIQDAGLYTHQRTLDIRFVDDELALHAAGRIRGSGAFSAADKQYMEMQALGGLEPKVARMKRVFSTECLPSHKRSKSVQIGKEIVAETEDAATVPRV